MGPPQVRSAVSDTASNSSRDTQQSRQSSTGQPPGYQRHSPFLPLGQRHSKSSGMGGFSISPIIGTASNSATAIPSAAQGRSAKALQARSLKEQCFLYLDYIPKSPVRMVVKPDPVDGSTPSTRTLYSKSVKGRSEQLTLSFEQSSIKRSDAMQLESRLNEWDPFWQCIASVAAGTTYTVKECLPKHAAARTAARIFFDLRGGKIDLGGTTYSGVAAVPGLQWGKTRAAKNENGDLALLLRMIPIVTPLKQKRADCHLWPKGTFLQINGNPQDIKQRYQQSHDHNEWKGKSQAIDISEYVNDPKKPVVIDLCCHDEDLFQYSLALVQFQSPDILFGILTGSGPDALPVLSKSHGLDKAAHFAQKQTFVIDAGDDGNVQEGDGLAKFVFCLTCPISKQLMVTPVRPKACTHWQCFDLKNYLLCNEKSSLITRWRCPSCERFVSLKELKMCSLTSEILLEFEGVASPQQRDRVEFSTDRTYKLLPERRRRQASKRPAPVTNSGQPPSDASQQQKTDPEVFIL
jgi:hypothetical protein